MYLNEYQEKAISTAVYPGAGKGSLDAVGYCSLKLAGEAGEVAEKIAKYEYRMDPIREATNLPRNEYIRFMIKKELGDVLWYIAALAREYNLDLDDIARANLAKLADRASRGVLKGSGDER